MGLKNWGAIQLLGIPDAHVFLHQLQKTSWERRNIFVNRAEKEKYIFWVYSILVIVLDTHFWIFKKLHEACTIFIILQWNWSKEKVLYRFLKGFVYHITTILLNIKCCRGLCREKKPHPNLKKSVRTIALIGCWLAGEEKI